MWSLAVTSSLKQVLLGDLWAEGDDRELDRQMRSRISVSTDGQTVEADGHKSGLILAFYYKAGSAPKYMFIIHELTEKEHLNPFHLQRWHAQPFCSIAIAKVMY